MARTCQKTHGNNRIKESSLPAGATHESSLPAGATHESSPLPAGEGLGVRAAFDVVFCLCLFAFDVAFAFVFKPQKNHQKRAQKKWPKNYNSPSS